MFLLHPNEALSSDRLAQALWGEDAPATSLTTVRVHVSRLRRALDGDAELLTTSPAGYRLRVRPGELDSERFRALVDTARGAMPADPDGAGAALREALALWRGPPLADLASASFAQAAIARLEDERLDALELRIEADLALGRHDELVAELQALVDHAPHRERLHAQLMLALYRSGRQTEALEAFRRLRAELVDALGIEPGTETRDLEAAILRHDPALAPPCRAADRGTTRESRPAAPVTAAETLIVLGTVVAVATGMAVLASRRGHRGAPDTRGRVPRADRPCLPGGQRGRACSTTRRSGPAPRTDASAHDPIAARRHPRDHPRDDLPQRAQPGRPPVARRPRREPRSASAASTVWGRNLERARQFAVRLDRSTNRADLRRAIAPLTAARPAIERDLVTLATALQRLGGQACRIHGFGERPALLPPLEPGEPLGPDVNPPPLSTPDVSQNDRPTGS